MLRTLGPGQATPDATVLLRPGDGLLLVTNGVAECFNAAGEAYGEERLLAMLSAAGPVAPDRLLASLTADLDGFSDGIPASDDVAALMMRFGSGAAKSAPR